jgi:malonyl-CoA/methylmalonyl-CoA synthetase
MSHNLFSQIFARISDLGAPFIRTAEGRVITYGDASALSARYANVLRNKGVVIGDRVAAQIEKSPEAIILYLACLRVGAAFLPLNTAYTTAELEYFIGDATPHIFVCDPGRENEVASLCERLNVAALLTLGTKNDGTLPELAAAADKTYPTAAVEASDLAAMLYTSGTTGRSKGAMLTHANLSSNARTLVDYWQFTRDDVLLHALPIFHTHGLFVATNVVLFAGASMIFLPKFDVAAIRKELQNATTLMGVPTFYTRLVKEDWLNRENTNHMRLFISGSAPLLAETHRQWTSRTGHHILERYGMTETNMITSNPYDGERVPGAVGFPLPGVSVRITSLTDGEVLPANEVGMIEVKGPNVFKGYWRMPDKTRAEFRDDGYFITGDLGVVDDRGYLSIVGRNKDLVITGGYNVYPKEIETEIDGLDGVNESAVIGLPHSDLGEGVTAVVVLEPAATLTEEAVLKALDGRLARYKLPKRVVFDDTLPRNAMGKVLKADLRKKYENLYK